MPSIRLTSRVASPPDRVFDAYTDFGRAPERLSGVVRCEVLTEGPVGVGTRFRETRMMFKREATETLEVTAFEPGRSVTIGCESCGVVWSSEFSFTPEGGGTRVDLVSTCRARSLGARLMAPMWFVMSGTMKKMMLQDMTEIKAFLESGS